MAACFGAAIVCGRAQSAQDSAAATLLAKHRAYAGWQLGDGTLAGARLTGSVTNARG